MSLEDFGLVDEYFSEYTNIGEKLLIFLQQQSEWSQATFGLDSERGPIGPLKHLEKEAREAQAAPMDIEEYADILLLLFDSSRRAGFTPLQLIEAGIAKVEKCKTRVWNKPINDEPVEHIR